MNLIPLQVKIAYNERKKYKDTVNKKYEITRGQLVMEKVILDQIINQRQVKTVFQPIISFKNGANGEIMGYEALSRFTNENNKLSPDEIFSAAKVHHRLWDLELLCRTIALETAQSHNIIGYPHNKRLFLNVSPQLMDDEAHSGSFTANFLKEHRISPGSVAFEITERNVIDDIETFKKTVEHYKKQDYLIAIDDAGAGYAGLNLISDVNPNFIKLDMQLIRNIDSDHIKGALVKGMVEFSKITNVELIAEGIETYEELETVINLGVQYGQGYFIQKPDAEFHNIRKYVIEAIQEINLEKNKMLQNDIYYSSIKQLSEKTITISPNQPTSYAYDLINQDPNCIGLCVIENDVPVGIITKEKLALTLSGRYGFTLYQDKPVSVIMDRHFLSVDSKTPVNIVSAQAMERSNDSLYDFVVVTENSKYIGTVTIKKMLQKATQMEVITAQQQSPLTGLPGNSLIQQKLSECIDTQAKFSVTYLDIDHFKSYNDQYGFEQGDAIIKLLADILQEAIPNEQFIGHIGGDDFIVVFDDYYIDEDFKEIVELFEASALDFYNATDRENGYITAMNRYGVIENTPLITLTSVTINNEKQTYNSPLEVTEALANLKNIAKRTKNIKWSSEKE